MAITLNPQTAQHLENFQSLSLEEQSIVTKTLEHLVSSEGIDSADAAFSNSKCNIGYRQKGFVKGFVKEL
jgi:hypothetical protein